MDSAIDRKALKRADGFTKTTRGFFDGIAENGKAWIALLGIVIVAAAGLGFYLNQREAHSNSARDALYKAKLTASKEMSAMNPAKPAAADDKAKAPADPAESSAFKKIDVNAQMAGTVKGYREVAEKYSGTRAAFEADLALGDLYADHGQSDLAIEPYRAAVSAAPGKWERSMSAYSLGYALEGAGKYPEAIQAYEGLLNAGELGIKGDLLLAIARCYELTHDTAKARSTYDQLLSQLPNTQEAKTAELLKARLE